VENRVNFSNPVNLIPCAIGLVAGAGNYTLIFDHGNVSFNGIAMGAFGVIIAYQLMRWLSKYGVFHDGQPAAFANTVPTGAEPVGPTAEPVGPTAEPVGPIAEPVGPTAETGSPTVA
jgi:hypothetical protein